MLLSKTIPYFNIQPFILTFMGLTFVKNFLHFLLGIQLLDHIYRSVKTKQITSHGKLPQLQPEELTGSAKSQSIVIGTSGLKENVHLCAARKAPFISCFKCFYTSHYPK